MSSTQESVPVYVPTANGEVIQQAYVIDSVIPQAVVNTEITNDMVKTFNLARTVKFLAIVDMFFSFIYCFYNPWFLIPLLIALFGYQGASRFNASYTFIYATYVVLDLFIKTGTFFHDYFALTDEDKAEHLFNVILVILSALISIWIIDILYKFIKLINKLTLLELDHLRNRGIPRHRLVYVWY
tara:strand:- start:12409 stop:12960 length:552 start_codon:yes stop_codon:yes gene_type:complete